MQARHFIHTIHARGGILTKIKNRIVKWTSDYTRAWKDWPVWKTLSIAKINNDELPVDFKHGSASIMLKETIFPKANLAEVDLVIVSGRDLGFDENFFYIGELFNRAIKYGLQICPAYIGPWLRGQYQDQPESERLFIGMNPMIANGSLAVFVVQNFMELTLSADYCRSDIGWYPDFLWVFIKPRK